MNASFAVVRIVQKSVMPLMFVVGALVLCTQPSARAQIQDPAWTEPYRLSQDGNIQESAQLVADPYGYVHAFWVETDLPDERTIIQYARFDGEAWTAPLDIFATEPNAAFSFLSATIDGEGFLHLAWSLGNRGPVLYSSAPAHDALSAMRWPRRSVIGVPAQRLQLQVDAEGVVHLAYTNFFAEFPGVYYTRSTDEGASWSTPVWIDSDIPPDYAPASLQFVLDEEGGLHMVWIYGDLTSSGFDGRWIRYAHSLDGGESWSIPFTVDREEEPESGEVRAGAPILTAAGETLHILWAGDAETHREHRVSTDAGQTWREPVRIFGELHGQAGDGFTVDAQARIHYFGQIRYPQGIYHAVWDKNNWIGPQLLYSIQQGEDGGHGASIHAHNVRPAMRGGSQLVVTFTNSPAETERILYAIHQSIENPTQLQIAPTPSPVAQAVATAPANPTAASPEPSSTATAIQIEVPAVQPASVSGGMGLLLWVLFPTTVLILGTVALRWIRM